jgi:peptidoglycan/xylan/chitin deacetylase (PgdA/CDA1 family)
VDQRARKHGDQAAAHDPAAPAGMPRRRMLLSSGGIMLLAVGAASAGKAALPGGMVRTGGARTHAVTGPRSAPLLPSPAISTPRSTPSAPERMTFPRPRMLDTPQYYVDDAGPMAIALTLDDGPDPVYTPQVLEVLRRYDVRATFNMIGEQIGSNLSLVREVAAAGHTITNHTWDHPDMSGYPVERVLGEIDRCNEALAEAGQEPRIFRSPFGLWTPEVFEACEARGLTPLDWSVDPRDWDTDHVTTQDIVRTVLRTTHRHDIILEHDGGGDRRNTVAALRIFIPELLDRGFIFAAV